MKKKRPKSKKKQLPIDIDRPKAFLIIVVVTLSILSIWGQTKTPKNTLPKSTQPEATASALNTETSETLKEVYEEEKGIPLGDFVPRYSTFENSDYGYRFAYPVGHDYIWNGNVVEILPKSGKGKIIVSAQGTHFEVRIESQGASDEELAILNLSADFIRQTFEFTNTRFSPQQRPQGNEGPTYKY